MKGMVKGLVIGLVIAIIGVVILLVALSLNGWKFGNPNFEMQTYTATEDNASLKAEVNAGRVKTEFYDGDKIVIEYPTADGFNAEIKEEKGTLKYSSAKIKWYRCIGWSIDAIPTTVIKLPASGEYAIDMEVNAGTVEIAGGEYSSVKIDVNAGTLSADGVNCDKFDCEVNAGSCSLKSLGCPDIKAEVNAGALSIGINGAKSDYNISASKSAGSCNVTDQTGNTDKKLRVEVSAGSASVSFSAD